MDSFHPHLGDERPGGRQVIVNQGGAQADGSLVDLPQVGLPGWYIPAKRGGA